MKFLVNILYFSYVLFPPVRISSHVHICKNMLFLQICSLKAILIGYIIILRMCYNPFNYISFIFQQLNSSFLEKFIYLVIQFC